MTVMPMARQQSRMCDEALVVWSRYGEALRERERLAGGMAWKVVKGREYLAHYRYDPLRGGKRFVSKGPRSSDTERLMEAFLRDRAAFDAGFPQIRDQADLMAKVAQVSDLGRMPVAAGDALRSLWVEGVLGGRALVIGTCALFGFETEARSRIDDELLRLGGVGLLVDGQAEIEEVFEGLRRSDKRLVRTDADRLEGRAGFHFRAITRQRVFEALDGSGELDGNQLDAVAWALRVEPWESVCFAKDGYAVPLMTPGPRACAILMAARHRVSPDGCGDRQATAIVELVAQGLDEPFHSEHQQAFGELHDGDAEIFGMRA